MSWFRNVKIGKKLAIGFGVVEILMLALGMFSLMELSKVNGNTVDLGANWLPSVQELGALEYQVAAVRRWELNMLVSSDQQAVSKAQEKGASVLASIGETEKKYEPMMSSDEERHFYTQFRSDFDKYLAVHSRVIQLTNEGKKKEAILLAQTEGLEAYTPAAKDVEDDVSFNARGGEVSAAQAASTYSSSRYWVIGTLLAAIVVGFVIATTIARSISGPATRMLAVIQDVAQNNLAVADMEIDSADEIGQAGTALNQMKNGLHRVIQSIAETAQHVASASEELSSTSQQITANSEETSAQANVVTQAAQQVNTNLQSVSTGAEEMTTTIQSIASNAHEAATVASNAVQTAQAANATVAKLGESSAEIGEVIKVITSIAQQTNLLALNATIEAARAGEAGKGFAVVANEVKELAKQTAKATEDISRKITAIQSDTRGAVDAIGSITAVIGQVNDISGTIATAVEEQSATTNEMTRNVSDAAKGSSEISHNIAGVAEAARGTSSSAQESQKASNELAEMAVQLRSLVAQFRINASAVESATPAPAVMRAAAGR
ncbi:MAG TPA: methyl-accepting chemotaxis protein [Verrucomicrobiae bacterium]|nr:methyl-accepting chemotaxis protein [Verrucomicrobiae bacterium]